ncbi:MAG: hypothetical protein J5801_00515 [Bacteroidales bacterium]|nr:hypothetical protein [Bacteroidales bacterium]
MKTNLYVSPTSEKYSITLRNAILQVSDPAIDPEASIDDMELGGVHNW